MLQVALAGEMFSQGKARRTPFEQGDRVLLMQEKVTSPIFPRKTMTFQQICGG